MAHTPRLRDAIWPLVVVYALTLLVTAGVILLQHGYDEVNVARSLRELGESRTAESRTTESDEIRDLRALSLSHRRFERMLTGVVLAGLLVLGVAFFGPAMALARRALRELEAETAQRARTEQSQRMSETRFRDVADSVADCIWEVDTQGRYTYCSSRYEQVLGYKPEELVGRSPFELLLPEDASRARTAFARWLSDRQPARAMANWYRHNDGRAVCLLTSSAPVLDEGGRLAGFRGVDHDITDRRLAEDALRVSEEKFRLLYEESPLGLLLSDMTGRAIQANPAFLRSVGYAAGELGRLTYKDITPPEYHSADQDAVQILMYAGRAGPYEKEFIRKDGTRVPVLVNGTLVDGPDGPMVWVIVEDISRRKQAERELAKAQQAEAELRTRIQEQLLIGRFPQSFRGAAAAALTVPSEQLDGDFYDVFQFQDYFDVVVGDVMGKGATAALVGAATKNALLRALTRLLSSASCGADPEQREPLLPDPARIVQATHEEMTPRLIEVERFVTLMYARFRVNSPALLTYVNAGHARPLHLRRSVGRCEFLDGGNVPLGFVEGEEYVQRHVTFRPGDLFLFYSDGVTEVRDSFSEPFGEGRLRDYVWTHRSHTPRRLLDGLRSALAQFCGGDAFLDDVTCVAVEIDGTVRERTMLISSAYSDLAQVRSFAAELCQAAGGGPDLEDRIALAMHECTTNIIRHAYGGRPDGPIEVKGSVSPYRIEARLAHLGAGHAPGSESSPTMDGSRQGGFGLYIIKRTADEVRYVPRGASGQSVSLVWYLDGRDACEGVGVNGASDR